MAWVNRSAKVTKSYFAATGLNPPGVLEDTPLITLKQLVAA